jgi:hypothetical protein
LTELVNGNAVTMRSAVVVLDCEGPEEQAESGRVLHHCPIQVTDSTETEGAIYLLPPLTLLTVLSVDEDEEGFEYMPGKFVRQKRIVVRPTFRIEQRRMGNESEWNKLTGVPDYLHYGGLRDGVRGVREITSQPVMTMQEEFHRNLAW